VGEKQSHEDQTEEDEDEYPAGLFGRNERKMFQDEILQQVVIGMGRLDAIDAAEEQDGTQQDEWEGGDEEVGLGQLAPDTKVGHVNESALRREDVVNPYFPPLPPSRAPHFELEASTSTLAGTTDIRPSPPTAGARAGAGTNSTLHVSFAQLPAVPSAVASYQPDNPVLLSPDWTPTTELSASRVQQEAESPMDNEYHCEGTHEGARCADIDGEIDEQAAVGRLSSMSLMAAVTANGMSCSGARASPTVSPNLKC
jgi:serine/threonine-protein phosphatase 4 regulatory subunit 1